MSKNLIKSFQQFQNILVLCPNCGRIHRLSEIKLSYRGKPRKTWLDKLEKREEKQTRAEERFQENIGEIKARAQEKGWKQMEKQLPKILKKCAPVICGHGYFPQDVKALFDPVDFVVFDGMNQKEMVKKVVLFDGPAEDKRREKAQESIQKVIRKGNFEWETVNLDSTTGGILEK
jgi:predicted Holliday junction resolvase-like endonuclease